METWKLARHSAARLRYVFWKPRGEMPTDLEYVLDELDRRSALIVHCSRPGKGDEPDGDMFPHDLREAMRVLREGVRELSCSVIWPAHQHTFGAVGIVLRPRSIGSFGLLNPTDGGTSPDPKTGKRVGLGRMFSRAAVEETFRAASDHNEWCVSNAEVIGIFLNRTVPPLVPCRVPASDIPGSEPGMFGCDEVIAMPVSISEGELRSAFPDLNFFSYCDGRLVVAPASSEASPA